MNIPESAFDRHSALLGMTGAGKTSVIKTAIVEPDLEADRRVLIITPKDDWWGLRLSKSGKTEAFHLPIFGGWHQDYPLNVKDAALLAEAYGTMKGSAIFCTSRLSVQDRARWFAAFAETLLAKNKGWVRLVIDEAHTFMPQQGGRGIGGAIPQALHAGNELVSQGRSLGLRIVLASQRSAKLHNDSLTQCGCLIAMRLMAPADKAAVKLWIEDQADPAEGKQIIASLANLNDGEAWVYAPKAKLLDRIQFARPKTFDSSAAPDHDDADGPKLKPVNLDALKGKLATIETEKKANDPAALKIENAQLRKELEKASRAAPAADADAIAAAEQRGFEWGRRVGLSEAHAAATEEFADMIGTALIDVEGMHKRLSERRSSLVLLAKSHRFNFVKQTKNPPKAAPAAQIKNAKAVAVHQAPKMPTVDQGDIPGPQRRILNSLMTWQSMDHNAPSNAQVAWLAGYSPTSTSYTNPRGALIKSGLIRYPAPDCVALTDEGWAVSHAQDIPNIREFVLSQLPGPEQKILRAAIEAHPGDASNEEIAEAAGYSASSTSYTNPRGSLSKKELITYPAGGRVKAADWLFA